MRNFEEILSAFRIASRNNQRVQAYCPSHADGKPSLSILQKNDGRVLLKCHAGCDTREILKAAGLTFADLSLERGKEPERETETIYPYHSESGEVLFEVVRFKPKHFVQRRADGRGGWIWNTKGVRRVLYRLSELIEAVNRKMRVYVVEGEKDVDTLCQAGLAATCNAGGAGKWKPEYSETLRSARVCIIPDNDGPGRKHAEQVARSLCGIGAEVKILELPGLPQKGDVSDWLANDGTIGQLERLADEAPIWEPKPETKPEPSKALTLGNLTDLFHARKIVELHGQDIRFCRKLGGYYVWSGKHWALDETGQVWRRAVETTERIYKDAANIEGDKERSLIREWAAKAERRAAIENALKQLESQEGIGVLPSVFDKDGWLFNVANGTLDLRTGERRPHRREDMITRCMPIEYHTDAECSRWLQFLSEIFDGNCRLMDFLQRVCGYALTGSVREQKVFFLHGSGANGKSTLLDTLLYVLGDYALRVAPDLLFINKNDTHPTASADICGKRLAITTEIEQGKRLAEVLIKELSGGDRIRARKMHKDYFEFEPTHKIFMCGNHMPVIRGTDHAIWRRIDLIPFTVTIPDDKQDKDLLAKLRAEASGILAWAVQGCLDWQKKGLAEPEEVMAATRAYRSDMDVLGDFLDECCEIYQKAEVASADLGKAYVAWCEGNGEKPISARAFGMHLKERGFIQGRAGNRRTRTWLGLALRTHADA